jgi:MFS family permease
VITTGSAKLTPNQIKGFWAAWAGWALDGMDGFIYALVMTPALREVLPNSGIAATTGEIGFYGGLLFALFLVGWGLSLIWGPVADRFGRVRVLSMTVLFYSVFTFAGAFATNVWELALFRFLAGIGIGGEWTLSATFVAEEWPEERRQMGAGYMQTGYYIGIILGALLNATIGAAYGWRAMFAIGGAPALLIIFIRRSVREPERWKPIAEKARPLSMIFSAQFRRRTLLNSVYLLVSIIGLWAGSVYVPSSVTFLANAAGYMGASAARIASLATVLLSFSTAVGCVVLPKLAGKYGRRVTLGFFFALMFLAISIGFGWVYYLTSNALVLFIGMLCVLGFGGANFTMYSLWIPEQYPTVCRASAFAFATSVGRFVGAGVTFLVGWGVSRMGTIGTPVAFTSIAFLIGMFLLPWGLETKGEALPD